MLVLVLCVGTLCSCGADAAELAGAYGIEENIYYATLVDKAYNPDDGYAIEKKDGKAVFSVTHVAIYRQAINEEIGELKSFSLSNSNFDKLTIGEAWQEGTSAAGIRKANKAAWKTEYKSGEAFYVLLQDDGSVLVAAIKTKEGAKYCAYIRKIAK